MEPILPYSGAAFAPSCGICPVPLSSYTFRSSSYAFQEGTSLWDFGVHPAPIHPHPPWSGLCAILWDLPFSIKFLYVPIKFLCVPGAHSNLFLCVPLRSHAFCSRRVEICMVFLYVPVRSCTPSRCLERCATDCPHYLHVRIKFLHVLQLFCNRFVFFL